MKLYLIKIKYMIFMIFILPVYADVDYYSEIQPIFNSRCTSCHGGGGGLSLWSYENVMNGGNSGDMSI